MTKCVRTCYGDYMKNEITVTELRSNIYAIIDEVIRTGEPVAVRRNNKIVTVAVPKKTLSKGNKKEKINDLSKLRPFMKLPYPEEDYISMNPDEWKPS